VSSKQDLNALYTAVVDNPEDDAPRLAFAAACDALGDTERADFIRIQVAHRQYLRAKRPVGEFPDLYREFALKKTHGPAWAGPINGRVRRYGFAGGFVEWIEVSASQFIAEAEQLHRLAPVRKLTLTGVSEVLESLVQCPHLDRIVSLDLGGQHIGDRGAELLAGSDHLRKLAWLDLPSNDITSAGLEALAATDKLPALQAVDFYNNPVANEVDEPYGNDQGQIVWVGDGAQLLPVEQRHGRKRWLHRVWELGPNFSEIEL